MKPGSLSGAGQHVLLVAGSLVMMLPFIWMIATSLEQGGFANYVEAWSRVAFGRYFLNTIMVTSLTVLGVLITSCLAAYAFATMEFRGRSVLFLLFLSTMMVPQPVYLAPSYVILSRLRWIDTYMALIVPWTANVFSIFLLRQHFMTLPRSLYEAATLDGCGRLEYLWRVVLPLSRSVIATVILFNVIGSWNSFMWPLVVTHSEELRVLQVGLSYFNQELSSNYQLLMAASTFCTLPLLLMFVLTQKQIVASYARSGIKS
ncbi:carbohydrate ABC transporter permease [Candidatus Fermentibacterales bacterium]|nr:carbohydrate ABC transporter permease [Candidatus Fermentibacterales bacterium]